MQNNSQVINIYPKCLEFYVDDLNSHKQIATLYNQFDFFIKYKILSTAPKKYIVNEPEGFLAPKTSVNL